MDHSLSVCSGVYSSQKCQKSSTNLSHIVDHVPKDAWSDIKTSIVILNLCFFGPGLSLPVLQLLSASMGQDHLVEHKINGRKSGWSVVNITCWRIYSNRVSVLGFHWLRKLVVQFTFAYCPRVTPESCINICWPRLKTVCRTCEKCVNSIPQILKLLALKIFGALKIIERDKELFFVWIMFISIYHIGN